MTKTRQQLQITIFKVVVFVVCRATELHPFVGCLCFLSGSGISDQGHLHWKTCCIDTCNIFFSRGRVRPGEMVSKREHKTNPHSWNVTKHSCMKYSCVYRCCLAGWDCMLPWEYFRRHHASPVFLGHLHKLIHCTP